MATNKRPTMLRLPDEMFLKIHSIAALEHRSMNKEIEFILESYIRSYETEHGKVPLPDTE